MYIKVKLLVTICKTTSVQRWLHYYHALYDFLINTHRLAKQNILWDCVVYILHFTVWKKSCYKLAVLWYRWFDYLSKVNMYFKANLLLVGSLCHLILENHSVNRYPIHHINMFNWKPYNVNHSIVRSISAMLLLPTAATYYSDKNYISWILIAAMVHVDINVYTNVRLCIQLPMYHKN